MSKKNKIIEYLWQILDAISTVDDIAKENDAMFRKRVMSLQSEKDKTGITSDGYKLDLSRMRIPDDFGKLRF